jgi:hypothetical protein
MKIILVIQSLIILAGAYYIYTLQATTPDASTIPVIEEVVPVATTTIETKEEVSVEPAVVPQNRAPIAAPNDAGMEWPTLEEDVQAQ